MFKCRLIDLLDNLRYYEQELKVNPKKPIKIRFAFSRWQYFSRKSELAISEKRKIEYELKAKESWKEYISLLPGYNNQYHNP